MGSVVPWAFAGTRKPNPSPFYASSTLVKPQLIFSHPNWRLGLGCGVGNLAPAD